MDPPAGPGGGGGGRGAGGNLFGMEGESLFGGGERNPSKLLEPLQLVVDGISSSRMCSK